MATEQTIIVIEDDPNIADLLDTYLRGAGFRVLLAGEGERGLELIAQHSPHSRFSTSGYPTSMGSKSVDASVHAARCQCSS